MKNNISKRLCIAISAGIGLCLVAAVIGLLTGSAPLSLRDLLEVLPVIPGTKADHSYPTSEAVRIILYDLRLPRVLLGLLVGSSLAMAGTSFQGILRNPLADPYIVGTSAGASVGATLAIVLHLPSPCQWLSALPACAFIGALLAMALVFFLSHIGKTIPVTTFLLAGVVVGSFSGALVSFLMTIAGQDLQRVVLWLMGSLGQANESLISMMLPYTIVGSLALLSVATPLNLISMGEESAQSLGVNVERLKVIVIVAGSLLTASAVAASGLIGFLGLLIPHITRLLAGPDHRILLPLSGLLGAAFLVLMDALSCTIIAPAELPVGIITALIGAPFFFWILHSKKQLN